MTRLYGFLVVLLAAQLGLTALLFIGSQGELSEYSSDEKFVGVDSNAFDRFVVASLDRSMEVKKEGSDWILPEAYGAKVSASKVAKITEELLTETRSFPAGSTSAAALQFKVSEDDFERKITLFKGNKELRTVFFGTSPGFKKVHARIAGEEAIYPIKFNTVDILETPMSWYDRTILRFPEQDIVKLTIGEIVLERDEDGPLVLQGLTDGEEVKTEKVEELMRAINEGDFQDIIGLEEKPEYKLESPTAIYTVELSGGEKYTYNFSGPLEDNNYVLKTSRYPQLYKVSESVVKELTSLKREDFVSLSEVLQSEVPEKMEVPAP